MRKKWHMPRETWHYKCYNRHNFQIIRGQMSRPSTEEITGLLLAWGQGNAAALERLMPLVYDELHRLAHQYMNRERAGHTLQTTGLVNEAYLRLVDMNRVQWQNRAHFFAISAKLMRRILVDFARSRNYLKRGGKAPHVSLDETLLVSTQKGTDLVALDDALNALSQLDPRKSKVVEMRFFGGMSVEETAEALNVSPETVMRDWKTAKVWLLRELSK
jgi:RNA polymerase sigma factor (TIGR02999 family)